MKDEVLNKMKDKNNIAIEYYHADIEMWLERQITLIFMGLFFMQFH